MHKHANTNICAFSTGSTCADVHLDCMFQVCVFSSVCADVCVCASFPNEIPHVWKHLRSFRRLLGSHRIEIGKCQTVSTCSVANTYSQVAITEQPFENDTSYRTQLATRHNQSLLRYCATRVMELSFKCLQLPPCQLLLHTREIGKR